MEITFYEFLELPFLRQQIEYNKIRKTPKLDSDWKVQLVSVCTSGELQKLTHLALTPFVKKYLENLKSDNVIGRKKKSILSSETFLVENNIPERYANLLSDFSLTQLKEMSLVELILINGIGNSTAKKIHKLFN
tara:strand:+ start:1954 stop:2355 length:402 start_codon:yes stop_codon:yes gene_type:complete